MRPPGHHAEPNHAMGFCLFNNIAIAAAYARQHHGLQRAAIVDFDAHRDDSLENIKLVDDDYRCLTERLLEIAEDYCGGRIVSALEGGYNLNALARSVAAHVKALQNYETL